MAKRGTTRPWRIRFEWSNGVKGTQTTATEEDARSFEAELHRVAELRDTSVAVTIEKREAK